MSKPVYTNRLTWNGTEHIQDLYLSDDLKTIEPKKQVQAVCFDENNKIVIYKHIDGYWGLPGGKIENNEDYKTTIKREILEEINAEVLDCGPLGYIKDHTKENPGKCVYQLRMWAKVKLLSGPVKGPCRKSLKRVAYDKETAVKMLGWGKLGEILINESLKLL